MRAVERVEPLDRAARLGEGEGDAVRAARAGGDERRAVGGVAAQRPPRPLGDVEPQRERRAPQRVLLEVAEADPAVDRRREVARRGGDEHVECRGVVGVGVAQRVVDGDVADGLGAGGELVGQRLQLGLLRFLVAVGPTAGVARTGVDAPQPRRLAGEALAASPAGRSRGRGPRVSTRRGPASRAAASRRRCARVRARCR